MGHRLVKLNYIGNIIQPKEAHRSRIHRACRNLWIGSSGFRMHDMWTGGADVARTYRACSDLWHEKFRRNGWGSRNLMAAVFCWRIFPNMIKIWLVYDPVYANYLIQPFPAPGATTLALASECTSSSYGKPGSSSGILGLLRKIQGEGPGRGSQKAGSIIIVEGCWSQSIHDQGLRTHID